jgi:integrase
MEVRAFESRKARGFLIGWRDQYAATPKTADDHLGAVSAVLSWAADRGEIVANPVKEFPRIYKVNRAELIWEPHHLTTLLRGAAPEFEHAVRLAALTGLREEDLIRLPRSAVGEKAIIWQTGKSRGRKTVVIPITKPLAALLAEIPERDCVTVLSSSRKRPWTLSGLAAALRRARIDAQKHAAKVAGVPFDEENPLPTGIEGLRFHDLRGTAATNFILAGLKLDEVALIMGWKLERVREIAARYVSGEAMGMAMVRRLGRNAPRAG